MRDILDLDRFPIDRPGSAEWNNLVENCRNDLEQDGMFNLDGLMRGQIAAQAVSDMAPRFESEAFLHERRHNIYFKKIADLPEGHPALQEFQTSNRTLCADQIDGSALLRLYEWPEFAQFLAATMGKPALHVMDDPLARVNVMSYQEGQALNWHSTARNSPRRCCCRPRIRAEALSTAQICAVILTQTMTVLHNC